MRFVRLEPDARLGKLGVRGGVAAVLLLAVSGLPLIRLQLGLLGWEVLREGVGPIWWPLAGLAAGSSGLVLAYGLWLRERPCLAPLLVAPPMLLVLGGVAAGWRGPGIRATGAVGLGPAAESLFAPAWSLLLAAGVAAPAALLLAALSWRRARLLGVPWATLGIAAVSLVALGGGAQLAHLPARPYTAVILGTALIALVVLEAPLVSTAPPHSETWRASESAIALVLAAEAVLAVLGGESFLYRAAALLAQGPGSDSHVFSQALGGVRSTAARALGGLVPLLGLAAALTFVARRVCRDRGPSGRSPFASAGFAVALLLVALGLAALGAHRVSVLGRAARARSSVPVTPSVPLVAPTWAAEDDAGSPPRQRENGSRRRRRSKMETTPR